MVVLQMPKLVRNAEISEKCSLTASRVAWQRYFIYQYQSEQETEAARAEGDHHHPSSSWRDGVTVQSVQKAPREPGKCQVEVKGANRCVGE